MSYAIVPSGQPCIYSTSPSPTFFLCPTTSNPPAPTATTCNCNENGCTPDSPACCANGTCWNIRVRGLWLETREDFIISAARLSDWSIEKWVFIVSRLGLCTLEDWNDVAFYGSCKMLCKLFFSFSRIIWAMRAMHARSYCKNILVFLLCHQPQRKIQAWVESGHGNEIGTILISIFMWVYCRGMEGHDGVGSGTGTWRSKSTINGMIPSVLASQGVAIWELQDQKIKHYIVQLFRIYREKF